MIFCSDEKLKPKTEIEFLSFLSIAFVGICLSDYNSDIFAVLIHKQKFRKKKMKTETETEKK